MSEALKNMNRKFTFISVVLVGLLLTAIIMFSLSREGIEDDEYRERYEISFFVRDEEGESIEGAEVSIFENDYDFPMFTPMKTDEDGLTPSINPKKGEYKYSIKREGYKTSRGSISVEEDKLITRSLEEN